jgi:hypothetical protein
LWIIGNVAADNQRASDFITLKWQHLVELIVQLGGHSNHSLRQEVVICLCRILYFASPLQIMFCIKKNSALLPTLFQICKDMARKSHLLIEALDMCH